MVVFGVLTPTDAYAAISLDTICLLFGTMVLSEYLKVSGFYNSIARHMLHTGVTQQKLLLFTVVTAGLLSAFLVNDTVCFMLTPLVVHAVRAAGFAPVPFMMALATSSNIGSALTLTGNPQNMLVGNFSKLNYLYFSSVVAIPVFASLGFNWLLLRVFYKKELAEAPVEVSQEKIHSGPVDRRLVIQSVFCVLLAVVGFAITPLTGASLAWTSLACAVLLLATGRIDTYGVYAGIDWTLLVFFSGLFIVVGGLDHTGILNTLQRDYVSLPAGGSVATESLHLGWVTILGSQIFSNVPYVMVTAHWIPKMKDPGLGWVLLAYISTVAGNLTILGSVANVIVLERARDVVRISFWEYFKFGAITTLVSSATGVVSLLAFHSLGWI